LREGRRRQREAEVVSVGLVGKEERKGSVVGVVRVGGNLGRVPEQGGAGKEGRGLER
jgi:hypothetical protein